MGTDFIMDRIILELFDGTNGGGHFELKQLPASIGRLPENDVKIPLDEYVSQKHCTIFEENGEFYLADLRSSNGTYLNNELIKKSMKLKSGDVVNIGNTSIRCSFA